MDSVDHKTAQIVLWDTESTLSYKNIFFFKTWVLNTIIFFPIIFLWNYSTSPSRIKFKSLLDRKINDFSKLKLYVFD